MKKLLTILLFPLFTNAQIGVPAGVIYTGSTPFVPTDIAGLKLWIDANTLALSDNDPVATWTDLSGNGNDADQATSGNRPLYKTNIQNGKPIIRFDGTDDFLEIANTSIVGGEAGMTVFIVVKQATLASDRSMLAKWDYATDGCFAMQTDFTNAGEFMCFFASSAADAGGNRTRTTNASLTTAFYLLEMVFDGSQSNADRLKFYRNTTLLTTTTDGTINTTVLSSGATLKVGKFGGVLDRYWNGDIGAIFVFDSALSDVNRGKMQVYINSIWALY